MTDTDYELLNAQLRAMLAGETDKPAATSNYLTRETYSRERVSTLIVSP